MKGQGLGIVPDGAPLRKIAEGPEIAEGDISIQSIPHSDKENPEFLYVLPK